MEIQRTDMGPVTVLRPMGEIDLEGVNALRVTLLECIKEKRVNVVVNCAGIRNISYLGVGVLVERMRQLRASGGDLRLAELNLCVRQILHMAGIATMFNICETETQALESFREAA